MCPCIVADGLTKELGRMKADPTAYTAEFYGDVEGFLVKLVLNSRRGGRPRTKEVKLSH
ncbi:hypothetical protein I315_06719 [Cryptococcus gattii Ru294]|nr:hypothetical protein I315_06719 [Cryptococcus gattii Ru294]